MQGVARLLIDEIVLAIILGRVSKKGFMEPRAGVRRIHFRAAGSTDAVRCRAGESRTAVSGHPPFDTDGDRPG